MSGVAHLHACIGVFRPHISGMSLQILLLRLRAQFSVQRLHHPTLSLLIRSGHQGESTPGAFDANRPFGYYQIPFLARIGIFIFHRQFPPDCGCPCKPKYRSFPFAILY
jgi:hypothetical protein